MGVKTTTQVDDRRGRTRDLQRFGTDSSGKPETRALLSRETVPGQSMV